MSQNAYAYTNRPCIPATDPTHPPGTLVTARRRSTGRGGLSFTSHALFRAIEDIAAWQGPIAPCPEDAMVRVLAGMVEELKHYGIRGYWRLRAWVRYHGDAVRKVGRSGGGRYGVGAGVAWLLDEACYFRDLALCYFEAVDWERERERKDRRKGMLVGK